MAASYKQFLAAPNTSLLADTAALHYVTTTTSIVGSTQIIQHFNSLQKQLAKKKEDILNLVDGQTAIAVEVDTGIEFKTGGGPYLPSLDDNFLAARTVYLPIVSPPPLVWYQNQRLLAGSTPILTTRFAHQ